MMLLPNLLKDPVVNTFERCFRTGFCSVFSDSKESNTNFFKHSALEKQKVPFLGLKIIPLYHP